MKRQALIVARDGSISAPYIGSIVVSESFNNAFELIRKKYEQSFLGIEAYAIS